VTASSFVTWEAVPLTCKSSPLSTSWITTKLTAKFRISYRIAGLNPTVIEEATTGTGDQCGGSFVDRAFFKWLERRLGTKDFMEIFGCRSEDVPHTSLEKRAARLLQDFILEAKSGFSGTETNYLRLPAPLCAIEEDTTRGICDGDIMITP